MNQKKVAPKLTSAQTKAMETMNISQKIRYLNKEGYTRADIARILNKRYQHVRNVLTEPTKS